MHDVKQNHKTRGFERSERFCEHDVFFIIGEAGTAKTTYLKKIVKQLVEQCETEGLNNVKALNGVKKIACLAFTHSAVNNLKEESFNKVEDFASSKGVKNVVFKTIHAFLGIVPIETGTFNTRSVSEKTNTFFRNKKGCVFDYDCLIVDEFTLIPIDLFNLLCSEYFEFKPNGKIVIAGDLLQLPPPDSNEFIDEDLFKLDIFKEVETDILTAIKIAKHLTQILFNSDWFKNSKKLILNKNFRNGSNVKTILDNALNCKFDFIDLNEVEKLILDGYIVIGSKYCHLKKIKNKTKTKTKIENCFLSPIGLIDINEEFYLTENIDLNFSNGDIVKIVDINETIKILSPPELAKSLTLINSFNEVKELKPGDNKIYPLMPVNFITIHKAQGKTFKKIVVILDDMFEMSMLYTAITRAQEDVKFIILNKDKDKVLKEIEEQNKAFKLLKDIVFKLF